MTPLEELPPPEDVLREPQGGVTDRSTEPPPMGPVRVAPPRKKRPVLLIIVIIVALLCCCGVGLGIAGVGWLADQAPDEPGAVDYSSPVTSTVPPPTSGQIDSHVAAWNAFPEELGVASEPGDQRQMRLARAIAARQTPGFTVVDLRVDAGGQDEDGFHIADMYMMRLAYDMDPSVELAYECYVATAEWVADGETWNMDSLQEWEVHATLEDGTEYTYSENLFPELAGDPTPAYFELLTQVGEDWPGGVDSWVTWYDDSEGQSAWAYPTTWDSYIDSLPFEGFEVGYVRDDSGWSIASWEPYSEADDE